MEGDRPQFDVLLGGTEELPQDFSLMEFASARAQEIVSIGEALQEPRRTGLVFQRLPRHMRRRIMSHNAKRMPRQLREAHQRQMEKGGLPPKSKRPSRKYRRRPSNLLEAYNRRQKENVWLETHIWHAKRFHMINKWGYRLPHFPNDKSTRACYRGAANHCLLQDTSYFVCIELTGSFENIINGLGMLTRRECGLSFRAKLWSKGEREGSVMLFHSDSKYPHGAIGRVSFLWKPVGGPDCDDERSESLVKVKEEPMSEHGSTENLECVGGIKREEGSDEGGRDSDQRRKLWIWAHPSYYNEVKEELVKVFKFEQCPPVIVNGCDEGPPPKRRKSEKSGRKKGGPKTSKRARADPSENVVHPRIAKDHIVQFFGSNVKMFLLKDMLVRLRLTGPLSHAVLREALAPGPSGCPARGEHPPQWWERWGDVFDQQNQLWEELSVITSPANMSPHMVLGLNILDPRASLPQKRTKAVDLDNIIKSDTEAVQGALSLPLSPIWDPYVRDIVTNSKPADAQMIKKRSENLVPGMAQSGDVASTSVENGDVHQRVPILLIQRPGSQDPSTKRLGYGSGWDLIAPASWGKPLWISMVLRGARAVGLREAEALGDVAVSRECYWPAPPDSNAGKVEMKLSEKEAKEKYFKLPPSKRPNYMRLGISSPYSCPWNILCGEWSSTPMDSASGNLSSDIFYVLRKPQELEQISNCLRDLQKETSRGKNIKVPIKGKQSHGGGGKSSINLPRIAVNGDSQELNDRCLIPVKVTVCKKGVVAKHAIICLPKEEDILAEGDSPQKSELRGPEEPINPDPYQEKRANARKQHKEKLRSLRRKRLKSRKEADKAAVPAGCVGFEELARMKPAMGPKVTADISALHNKWMQKLFIPTVLHSRKSCSREVVGYVTSGGFSFLEAREIGYGYIALPAVDSLIKTKSWNHKLLVFVRNTSSSHYFPATVEIVTN